MFLDCLAVKNNFIKIKKYFNIFLNNLSNLKHTLKNLFVGNN